MLGSGLTWAPTDFVCTVTAAVSSHGQLCFFVRMNLFPWFCRFSRDNNGPKNIHALFSKTCVHDILKKEILKVRLQLQIRLGLSVWAQFNTGAFKHGNHFQQTSEEMSQRDEAEGCSWIQSVRWNTEL